MNYDFITIGGATEDISIFTKKGVLIKNKKDLTMQNLLAFEYGAKIKIDQSFSYFGGGAANAAVCFSRLGYNTAVLVCLGNDNRAKAIQENFQKNKVNISLISKSKKESGFSFLLIGPQNEHIVFTCRAANKDFKITNKNLIDIKKSSWIYISSLQGAWKKNLDKIFELENKNITWNPGNTQIKSGYVNLKKYLKKTTILSLNKDEAIELAMSDKNYKNKSDFFFNNIRNLLKIINSWGVKIALITNGEKGADVFDGKIFYHENIIKPQKIADTTGVGDAFASSFTAHFFKTGNIKKSLKLGIKNTASVVKKAGAQNGLIYV